MLIDQSFAVLAGHKKIDFHGKAEVSISLILTTSLRS